MGNDKLDWALRLAREGFLIFPLSEGSKSPVADQRWGELATSVEGVIHAWFETTPRMNYGVCPGTSHVILDIDVKHGKQGLANFTALEGEQQWEDWVSGGATFTDKSPSGGYHHYLKTPFACSNTDKIFPDGIDVRGAGGYVVGPCCELIAGMCKDSDVPGRYVVEYDGPIIDAPQWIVALLSRQGEKSEHRDESLVDDDLPENVQRAIELLTTRKPAIEGQRGDDHTLKTAQLVRDLGISEQTCLDLIAEHYNERCEPPWALDELAVKVRNAYRYAERPAGTKASDSGLMNEAMARAIDAAPKTEKADDGLLPIFWESELDAIPDPVWLIEDYIAEGDLVNLYGPSGSLKTFTAIDIMVRTAAGMPWAASKNSPHLKGFKVPRPLRHAYLCGEGQRGIKKRIRALKKYLGITGDLPVAVIPVLPAFKSDENLKKIVATVKKKCGTIDVLWVDTVSRAALGLNLNIPSDFQIFESAERLLMHDLNCALVSITHTGKDTERGMQGAQQQQGNADVVLFATATPAGPGQRVVTIESKKSRDEEDGRKIEFEAKLVELAGMMVDASPEPGAQLSPQAGAAVAKRVTSLVLERIGNASKAAPAGPTYVSTAVEVLERRGVKALPLFARQLAYHVAKELAPTAEDVKDGTFEGVVDDIAKALKREATKEPALSKYARRDGTSKTAPWHFKKWA